MRTRLTSGKVSGYKHEGTSAQSFLWDSEVPGFGLRATPAGKRNPEGTTAYIFQSRLNGSPLRITIGSVGAWTVDDARTEARRLQSLIDTGRDPRQVKSESIAADEAKRTEAKKKRTAAEMEAKRATITLGEAWSAYVEARQKPPMPWGSRNLLDNQKIVRKPSEKKTATGKIRKFAGGALAPLVDEPLCQITANRVRQWLDAENETRGAQAALAYRLLSAFINWAAGHPDYKAIVVADACKADTKRHVQKVKAKAHDTLSLEQIKPWIESVGKIPNKITSTYLIALLLTGARRDEMAALKWENVDFSWNTLTIKDKVEASRTIPLPPYLRSLLLELHNLNQNPPKVESITKKAKTEKERKPSQFVFAANSEKGYLTSPDIAYRKAIDFAGLPHVTLHGLRRSFKNCADDAEAPAGVTAQLMGHKPSAIAERHYTARSLDTLTRWHTKIEGFILDQAGISQPQTIKPQTAEVAA